MFWPGCAQKKTKGFISMASLICQIYTVSISIVKSQKFTTNF